MFHAWAVKIAKMLAHSTPSRLPGNSAMNPVTVIERNPSTGTDWRMSITGSMTMRARGLLAARYPHANVNSSDAPNAMNMRSTVRAA